MTHGIGMECVRNVGLIVAVYLLLLLAPIVFDMFEILEDDEQRLELETLHFEIQMTCNMIDFWSSSKPYEYIINMLSV